MTSPRPLGAGDGTDGRMSAPESRLQTLVPILAGGIALIAYVRTMLPGLAFGDWGEMQTVPHVLGVAHPTGYPTYVLLAWAAQLVPLGTVAARENLLSAVIVAGSVAVASLILVRLGVRPGLAVIGSVAIAPSSALITLRSGVGDAITRACLIRRIGEHPKVSVVVCCRLRARCRHRRGHRTCEGKWSLSDPFPSHVPSSLRRQRVNRLVRPYRL